MTPGRRVPARAASAPPGGARPRHRIDDYAAPRLPWPLGLLNVLGRPLAGTLVRLDETGLLAAARRRTGLADFGDEGFREPLRVLLRALEQEAGLTPIGRLGTRQLVLQLLSTRLLVQDLVTREPAVLRQPVEAPIVIVGLPRSGTTHLHNLLGADPALRSLPYWESLEPVLPPGRRPAPGRPDPRIRRCAQALALVNWAMPLFRAMHEMTPEHVHEEIQLLAVAFSTMLFESSYQVPSYRDWYEATDQTPAYRFLRRMLQVLQWERGGVRRWVLKSPQHLAQLGPLLATFPDATIVQTHRDPVRVTASMCTMACYAARMNAGAIDPRRVGGYWAARVEDLLRASVRDRPRVPAGQAFDLRFHEFMPDNLAMAERIYAFAGQPFGEEQRRAMRGYLETHPPGRFGTVDYRLEDFGLDSAERRRALRFYQQRFDVPDEG